MNEHEHLWLLPAQRSLYYTKSAEFDAELAVTGNPNTLDLASVNRLTWLLQTTNFFYSDYIEDTNKLIDGDTLNFAYVPRCLFLPPGLRTASSSATLVRFDGDVGCRRSSTNTNHLRRHGQSLQGANHCKY
jgi:hypothetical protein